MPAASALMTASGNQLDLAALTVTGRPLGETSRGAMLERRRDPPLRGRSIRGPLAVLKGNLAPDGASSSQPLRPAVLDHAGPALVSDSYPELKTHRRRGAGRHRRHRARAAQAGPQGGPGMPEWGMLPMPKKLLQAGPARHAAHLRCAHARHELRRLRAACLAGSYVGGPLALSGPATSSSSTSPRGASTCWSRGGAGVAARLARSLRRVSSAARWMFSQHISRPIRAATSISCAGFGPSPASRTSFDAALKPPRRAAGAARPRSSARRSAARPLLEIRRRGLALDQRLEVAAGGVGDAVAVGADVGRAGSFFSLLAIASRGAASISQA